MSVKKGYKVVDNRNGNLTSGLVSAYVGRRQGGVDYREGKWTQPHKGNGPLGVFGSRRSAIAFCKILGLSSAKQVYSCDYAPSSDVSFWYRLSRAGERNTNEGCSRLPIGTVFADAVRPTKLVWDPSRCLADR